MAKKRKQRQKKLETMYCPLCDVDVVVTKLAQHEEEKQHVETLHSLWLEQFVGRAFDDKPHKCWLATIKTFRPADGAYEDVRRGTDAIV